VLAGNVHIGGLVPHLAETVLPINSYVAVTAPLGDRLGEAISWRGAVSDSRWDDHQYRIVDGDRLMWAGATSVRPRAPLKVAKRFKAEIKRVYPQLGEVEIAHVWSGVTGLAVHRMPQIGEISPGVWLASAFGGHGLNTSAMAGELIAQAIVEGDDRWRLFLPYELVWAGGAIGRALTEVSYWSGQVRETIAAAAARRREALRRDKAARDAGLEDGDQPHVPGRAAADEAGLAPADDADRLVSAQTGGPATGEPVGRRTSRKTGEPSRMVDPRSPAVLPATAEEAGGDH